MRFAWLVLIACSASTSTIRPQTGDPITAPIEREIQAGQSHRYRVRLAARDVLLATVEQRGIDVVVKTFDPAGTLIAEIDSPNGASGPEPVVIEAATAGEYAFEVVPFGAGEVAAGTPAAPLVGRYAARVDEVITAAAYEERLVKRDIESPHLFAVWRAARDGKPLPAITSPIVEDAGDPSTRLVTFVFRSNAPYVGLYGGPTPAEKPLQHIARTDVWFLTARMPADSRVGYAFVEAKGPPAYETPFRGSTSDVDERYRTKKPDPLNAKRLFDLSLLDLPGAPAAPFADTKPPAEGTLVPLSIESMELRETRKLVVYTPPGYDPKQRYPLVVVFDGEAAGFDPATPLLPVPRILDNLIAQKKIPPAVAAIVANQGTRARDLTASPAFARFVARELVPKLRADFNAGHTPATTVVAGASYGGLCAAYIALEHSDVVGNAISQSGAFGYREGEAQRALPRTIEPGYLIRKFVAAPKLPIRFWLDVGRFETGGPWDLLGDNRRMRDVLEAKGYSVKYVEYSGGHEYVWWRITIADALIALLN